MDHWKRKQEQREAAWKYLTETISPQIALLQECVPSVNINNQYKILYQEIGGTRKWGTAIAVRELPFQEINIHKSHPGAVVAAEITCPGEMVITVISLYGMFDNDGYVTTTLHRTLSDLTPLLHGERSKRLFIVGGDFNASTQWDERYKNRDPAHRLFFERLEDFGLINCTNKHYKKHVQTHRHSRSDFPWQDDYIYASKKIANKLVFCDIKSDKQVLELSDHNPVLAVFELW